MRLLTAGLQVRVLLAELSRSKIPFSGLSPYVLDLHPQVRADGTILCCHVGTSGPSPGILQFSREWVHNSEQAMDTRVQEGIQFET